MILQPLVRALRPHRRSGASAPPAALSGAGLALYGLTMTFAAFDWAMSLEPHWFSTIYGVMFIVGQVLATLALRHRGLGAALRAASPSTRWLTPAHFHDLGKLLFAFVMLWAYVAFSQFLIIWSGNLPEETPWYLNRTAAGWQRRRWCWSAALRAAVPACCSSRGVKRNARAARDVALLLLVLRLVDLYWLVAAGLLRRTGFSVALAATSRRRWPSAASWVGLFIGELKGRPLISLQDAALEGALEGAREGGEVAAKAGGGGA